MADLGTLGSFTDFMVGTRDLPLGRPDKISNQATTQRTFITRVMMKNLKESQYTKFAVGRKFVDQIQLKYTDIAMDYLPTDEHTPTGQSTLVEYQVPVRFKLVHTTWNDQEIELNSGGDQKTKYKDLAKSKRQIMFTNFWESVNTNLWAAPNADEMEGGTDSGKSPYSILCFVTIGTGVPNTTAIASGGDGATDTWTTVEAINPTTYTNWDNQRVSFVGANIELELENALDEMYIKLQWTDPSEGEKDKTGVEESDPAKLRIFTNREGYLVLVRLARNYLNSTDPKNASNLGWANGRVTYHGIPVHYIAKLDDVLTATKPRYYFLNLNHLHPIFHRKRFLFPKTFEGTARQPMANVEYRDTWWNLLCSNRREQGVVYAT